MQWTFIHLILKALKMNKITNRAVRSQILNSDFIIQRIRLEIYFLSFDLKMHPYQPFLHKISCILLDGFLKFHNTLFFFNGN